MTDKPRFLGGEKKWQPGFGPESDLKLVFFCHFLKFGSLVLLEIAYNDSLQQCLTSSRGKIHYKNFCDPNFDQMGQNRT